MVATTGRPDPSVEAAGILRFDRVERVVHWATALIFAVLVVTGALLYLGPLGALVGRRALVEDVHVYCGVGLVVPLLLGVVGPWGRALRQDLRRFNRWSGADRMWLASVRRAHPDRVALRRRLDIGKFNAGQKLNAAFTAGAGLVMLGTGCIMRWYHPWPLAWRTGATFVHDWLALALGMVIIGHVGMALRHPDALRSMWAGRISRSWAATEAPAWLDGRDGTCQPPPPLSRLLRQPLRAKLRSVPRSESARPGPPPRR